MIDRFSLKKNTWMLLIVTICCLARLFSHVSYAGDYSSSIAGKVYEFGEKDHYNFTAVEESNSANESNTFGHFALDGNITVDEAKNDIPSFSVGSGSASMFYSYTDALRDAPEEEWHLCDDASKTVADVKLKSKIQKGAIIV